MSEHEAWAEVENWIAVFEKIGEYEPGNRVRAILDWEGFRLADGPQSGLPAEPDP